MRNQQIHGITVLKLLSVAALAFLASGGMAQPASAAYGELDVFPRWVRFPDLRIGQAAGRTVTVRNRTNRPLRSLTFQSFGDRMEFQITPYGCWSIRPHGSCSLRVEYRPRRPGRHRLDVTIRAAGASSTRLDLDGYAFRRNPYDVPGPAAESPAHEIVIE